MSDNFLSTNPCNVLAVGNFLQARPPLVPSSPCERGYTVFYFMIALPTQATDTVVRGGHPDVFIIVMSMWVWQMVVLHWPARR